MSKPINKKFYRYVITLVIDNYPSVINEGTLFKYLYKREYAHTLDWAITRVKEMRETAGKYDRFYIYDSLSNCCIFSSETFPIKFYTI